MLAAHHRNPQATSEGECHFLWGGCSGGGGILKSVCLQVPDNGPDQKTVAAAGVGPQSLHPAISRSVSPLPVYLERTCTI